MKGGTYHVKQKYKNNWTTDKRNPISIQEKTQVCAYCRVSTDSNKEQSSYLAQAEYYKNYIEQHKEWELVGIYADESSGTKLKIVRPSIKW